MATWPALPFNAIISGVTDSGKTRFVLDLLETTFRGKFDRVVIFCPTFGKNKSYERPFVYRDRDVIVVPPQGVEADLDSWLRTCCDIYGGLGDNVLFLVDDCANQRDVKVKACELTRLAFSGRHDGISTWVLTQKYNAIDKDFRSNIKALVTFFDKDEDSLRAALSQNNVIPKEDRQAVIERLKAGERSKLIVRLKYPYDYRVVD